MGSLQFSYSILAASTLYHFSDEQSAHTASGKQTSQRVGQLAGWALLS